MKHRFRFDDLTGRVFNRLTVVGSLGRNSNGNTVWKCACVCGKFASVLGSSLRAGDTKSCGCLKSPPNEIKFFQNIKKTSYCWNWTGGKFTDGYGSILIAGKNLMAHRFSWMLHFGSIPVNLCVCHKCDNPSCVNPDHLFLGTKSDNAKDKVEKSRQAMGESHGNSKLLNFQVLEIRRLKRLGMPTHQIASNYNVCQSNVRKIVKGKTWPHLINKKETFTET